VAGDALTLGESYEGRLYHAATHAQALLAERDLAAFLASEADSNLEEGGRFNPPGEFGAVYLSLDRETAVAESSEPEAVIVLGATIRRVLALDEPAVRERWSVTEEALRAADYGPSRSVARRARAAGYDAIRSRSSKGRGLNMSVLWDARTDGTALRFVRADLR
jgi:hypothetical protein